MMKSAKRAKRLRPFFMRFLPKGLRHRRPRLAHGDAAIIAPIKLYPLRLQAVWLPPQQQRNQPSGVNTTPSHICTKLVCSHSFLDEESRRWKL